MLVFYLNWTSASESSLKAKFDLIFLGDSKESNQLSGILIASSKSSNYISIDAGAIDKGISHAIEDVSIEDSFFENEEEKENWILKEHVKAHLISRSHLNHLAALVMYSSIDGCKNIYAVDETINNIRDHLFNWVIWPNYADEGRLPHLKRYHYVRLPVEKSLQIPKTKFRVEPFLLRDSSGQPSTCFFIECEGEYFVYFGNACIDSYASESQLTKVWKRVAPLISQKKCHALFFEFTGSLTNLDAKVFEKKNLMNLLRGMELLAEMINPKHPQEALKGLNIILNHTRQEQKLDSLLIEKNKLGVKWFFPKQGEKLTL
jgi:cAMP phosphodiesterase